MLQGLETVYVSVFVKHLVHDKTYYFYSYCYYASKSFDIILFFCEGNFIFTFITMLYMCVGMYTHIYSYIPIYIYMRSVQKVSSHIIGKIETFIEEDTRYKKYCT